MSVLLLAGCTTPPATEVLLPVTLVVDGESQTLQLPPGATVQEALNAAGVTLGSLDRVDPPSFTVLPQGGEVTVVRVREEFEIEQVVIPFEQQFQPSEFLAEGEQQPLQLGENGLQEITYRRLYEDDVEVARSPIKVVTVKEAVPQIMLVGVQTSFTPLEIPGRLAYLSDGNAWMLEVNTANRVPIIASGDLDGRVFELSDDGNWLLFTRHSEAEGQINTLWAAEIGNPEQVIDLQTANIIHFAAWEPGSTASFIYSTVEPVQSAPGWQANNDLQRREFSEFGWVSRPEVWIDTNFGGTYGWWGTTFQYAPQADRLAAAGPDRVGLVRLYPELGAGSVVSQTLLLEITPLNTRGDWAWVPGLRWSPDGQVLFTVDHAPPDGLVSAEESPYFDLSAIPLTQGLPINLVKNVGMFAYPLPSPLLPLTSGEQAYWVAYLQARFPEQSETSPYRVVVMDRDGSNRRELFPPAEKPGLEPQTDWGAWAPQLLPGASGPTLALLYQGNIWLLDASSGQAWQVTGDGRIQRIDWR
ncbi:MAG: G5 domain-containing protein [Anaerolineales bacterium]|nr:G5 domain-containing protein [Anaerolineales bacterium]